MTPPARLDGPFASGTSGDDRDHPVGYPHDETETCFQRDLATVRALRLAGVEDIALLAAGLDEGPLEAVRSALLTFRRLSGLPELPSQSLPSDHS